MGCAQSAPVGAPAAVDQSAAQLAFRVKVLGALRLRSSFEVQAGQSNATKFESTRDPYVVVSAGGNPPQRTSTVVHNSESPTWNEEFYLTTDTETPELRLKVMDTEVIKGDILVGEATVSLHGLLPTTAAREMWLPIIDTKWHSAVPVVVGEIGITVVQCFRITVKIAKANIPALSSDNQRGSYVTVQAARQQRHETTTAAAKVVDIGFGDAETVTYFLPYGESSEVHVAAWTKRWVGPALCRGFKSLTLRGFPTEPRQQYVTMELAEAFKPAELPVEGERRVSVEVWATISAGYSNTTVVPAPPVTDAVRAAFPPAHPVTKVFECHVVAARRLVALQPDSEEPSLTDRLRQKFKDARGHIGVYTRMEFERDVFDTHHVKEGTNPRWDEKFSFFTLPVARAEGWEPEPPELRLSVWEHGLNHHQKLGTGFTRLEGLLPSAQWPKTFELERGGEVDVVFRSHFDVVVKVISATVASAQDPNGMSDTFVELAMNGHEFRSRVKHENRTPTYNDRFRFTMSPSLLGKREAMELRVGVYDMDLALFGTSGVATDLVGLATVDVSPAVAAPRCPIVVTRDVLVGSHVGGTVTLEITSEYLPQPNILVVHEARYGYADVANFSSAGAVDGDLWSVPPHSGEGHPDRAPGDTAPTWRDVTSLVQAMQLNNQLCIPAPAQSSSAPPPQARSRALVVPEPQPQQSAAAAAAGNPPPAASSAQPASSAASPTSPVATAAVDLKQTLWPNAVDHPAGKPRVLAVRFTIGLSEMQETQLEEGVAGSAIAIRPPSVDLLLGTSTGIGGDLGGSIMAQTAEQEATAARQELDAATAEAAWLSSEIDELEIELSVATSKQAPPSELSTLRSKIARHKATEVDVELRVAAARRQLLLAEAAAATAAESSAEHASQFALQQAEEADRLQQLRENFEKEAQEAEAARARRDDEEQAAALRVQEQEASLAVLRSRLEQQQEDQDRRQAEEEQRRIQQQMQEEKRRRQEREEQERQAKLLQERIERLKKQEEESVRRAEQSRREAEAKAAEAAKKAALAQKMAATRVTPMYWSDDADSYEGLRKIELSSDATWRQRFQDLLDDTCRRNTLGAGRDQIIKSGKYNRLLFHRAWRFENSKLFSLYATHRDQQIGTPKSTLRPKTHAVGSSRWIEDLGLRSTERNEFLLWHGTKPEVVDLIATEGFDERICRLSGLFGAGVYFADEVSKSDQYVTPTPATDPKRGVYHILLVRVTMGNSKSISSGTKEARRAPAGCHSIVGQIDSNKYKEYVIYDGWLAYPEFLIQYKRNYTS